MTSSGIDVAASLAITSSLPFCVSAKIGTPVPPWISALSRAASRTVPEAQDVREAVTALGRQETDFLRRRALT